MSALVARRLRSAREVLQGRVPRIDPWCRTLVFTLGLLAAACTTYQPPPLDNASFRERAVTQTEGGVTASVSALNATEADTLFALPLTEEGVQPVWIRVQNDELEPYVFLPIGVDPEYYSAHEVTYLTRSGRSAEGLAAMQRHLREQQMPFVIPANSVRSGFVYTERDEGAKVINVMLVSRSTPAKVRLLDFVVPVPGLRADYLSVDASTLYPADDYRDITREAELETALAELPCCTTGPDGKTSGDPVNLVLIGDGTDVFAALTRRGWDLTESVHQESVARTIMSSLFGVEYRHSPISPLYLYGRPQDIAFQKARRSVDERNHLRLWRAPIRYHGADVFVGQISRDIGVRFSSKTFVTHAIDPDVDDTRTYLAQDLLMSQSVVRAGYVKGVGPASPESPRYNYTEDPYFTDGLRLVVLISRELRGLRDIEPFGWEKLELE